MTDMKKKSSLNTLPARIMPMDFRMWSWHNPNNVKKPPIYSSTTHGQPISSVYGRIQTLVLFFPVLHETRRHPDKLYVKFLKELLRIFPGGNRLFILVVKDEYTLSQGLRRGLHNNASMGKNQIQILPVYYPHDTISTWARDSMGIRTRKLVNNQVEIELVEPLEQAHDDGITTLLYSGLETLSLGRPTSWLLRYQKAPFAFHGGNLLVGKRVMLMGVQGIKPQEYCSEEQLTKWWGIDTVILEVDCTEFSNRWCNQPKTSDGFQSCYKAHSPQQPIYHLDVFMTLAGSDQTDEEVFVIGQPECAFDTSSCPSDVKEHIEDIITTTAAAIEQLIEQLKQKLQRLGIVAQIIRNPLPLVYYDEHDGWSSQRHFCWATHNNALVERYKETAEDGSVRLVKHVLLPSYGYNSDYSDHHCPHTGIPYGDWSYVREYDLANKKLWEEELGYQVTLLKRDYNAFAKHLGALHCLTHCIERENN